MTHLHSAHRDFPDTSWTLLKNVSDGAVAAEALNEFTARYYTAIRSFITVIVRDRDLAQDLTQEFFQERVLRWHGTLTQADPARGRFRPFLKQSIRNFLVDKHRAAARTPRADVRPDAMSRWDDFPAERMEAADRALMREWGQSVVALALARVKEAADSKGQQEHFAMFSMRHLGDPEHPPSFREVGRPFGLDEKTARGRVHTIVNQFRTTLEDLLRGVAGVDADVEQEIRQLIELL
jgi:DNA-directed RNA polymerase specialized sigma24 family protein